MSTDVHYNCITPPFLLEKLLESEDPEIREAAKSTLLTSAQLRGERQITSGLSSLAVFAAPAAGAARSIYDAQHRETTHGAAQVRSESQPDVADPSVNHAFDGLGHTRAFYADVLGRDSIDGRGGQIDGYVHFGSKFNNAFWDGREMVFGDGDGRIFSDLAGSLDVVGHELTHGVTEAVAGLEYHLQSGALNESISDVFGSLVKQYAANQKSDEADWLIGNDVFTPEFAGDALRSLKAPGQAYDNPTFGHDQQPAHMKDFLHLPDTQAGDWGGVHVNSGIPNHAFYLVATALGGYAWETAGHIWFEALNASRPDTDFEAFATLTATKASQRYGASSTEVHAVTDAWGQVGIKVTAPKTHAAAAALVAADPASGVAGQLDRLSAEIDELSKLVRSLKVPA
ncbi:M4 family metallopeptidase [Cellulomonas sp. URHD0024]|uniref:M4 family metallopeptidase n=1 Tax=Cellulomonas sp. URHD0024 TaxID=1302620 RepID=UPI0003F66AD7|nr:M4 family metallopeptidase [Cellulomonas sp. URHD0024]